MASLYTPADQVTGAGNKSAAKIYKPSGFTGTTGGAGVDVIANYWWTLTPPEGRKEIPSIVLTEYEVDETTITRQIDFYVNGVVGNSVQPGTAVRERGYLQPYEQLFPKDKWTGFYYVFPFYTDINFEVNTPVWSSLDTLEAGAKGAADIGSFIHPTIGKAVEGLIGGATAAAGAYLAFNYPKVGIMDRPKLWSSHDFRSYTIKVPLYNTYNPDPTKPEWIKNRELCELLVNQNLYNKLSFITGIPPVFYEVLIPGQHYSPAACVTNLTVYNRGNVRLLNDPSNPTITYNVPDVYEINMTLTDLVIPSKNLFQAINDPVVRSELVTGSQGGVTDAVTSTVGTVVDTATNAVQSGLGTIGNAFTSIFQGLTPSNAPGVGGNGFSQSQFNSPQSP